MVRWYCAACASGARGRKRGSRQASCPEPASLCQSRRMYSIVLVDDHAIVREGFKRLIELEPDLEVVAECRSGDDAVDASLRPSSCASLWLPMCSIRPPTRPRTPRPG